MRRLTAFPELSIRQQGPGASQEAWLCAFPLRSNKLVWQAILGAALADAGTGKPLRIPNASTTGLYGKGAGLPSLPMESAQQVASG